MIVQCPKCQAKYRLEERHFGRCTGVQVLCTKCQTSFAVKAPAGKDDTARAAIFPTMPEATVVGRKGSALRLPEGKAVALVVMQGPLKGKSFRLTKPRVVVGRSGTDIVVEDPEVSRKHCALDVHGSTALLVDLGSTNGTFVDEQKIETYELEHLSEFRIGATTLMFTVTDKDYSPSS